MGAACAIRLREGDLYAARLLGAWLALRLRVLASNLLSRRWEALHEEVLVLAGTGAGIVHGLRHPARPSDGLGVGRRGDAR
jgi:hypothetical protein